MMHISNIVPEIGQKSVFFNIMAEYWPTYYNIPIGQCPQTFWLIITAFLNYLNGAVAYVTQNCTFSWPQIYGIIVYDQSNFMT